MDRYYGKVVTDARSINLSTDSEEFRMAKPVRRKGKFGPVVFLSGQSDDPFRLTTYDLSN